MAYKQNKASCQKEENERFDDMKLKELRADIHAGIASGVAGTLDVDQIKRRGRVRQAALRGAGQQKRIAD